MMEALHRADDALKAVKSAQEQGIVSGGGVALLNAVNAVAEEDFTSMTSAEQVGVQILFDACNEPIRQMATNAGLSPDIIINDIQSMKLGEGFNFFTGTGVVMIEEGIIDPVKVTKSALTNAVSAAGTLITTSHGIVETKD